MRRKAARTGAILFIALALLPKAAAAQSAIAGQVKDNTGAVSKAATARRGLMVPRLDLRPILPKIRQPVLMVCGDEDPIVPRACEGPLLEGLPLVERVEVPGCGHYPQYTHAPLVAELVRRFFTAPTCQTS